MFSDFARFSDATWICCLVGIQTIDQVFLHNSMFTTGLYVLVPVYILVARCTRQVKCCGLVQFCISATGFLTQSKGFFSFRLDIRRGRTHYKAEKAFMNYMVSQQKTRKCYLISYSSYTCYKTNLRILNAAGCWCQKMKRKCSTS